MKLRDHRIFNRGRQTRQSLRSAEESAEMSAQMIQETNHFETAIVTEFISHPESFLRTSVTVDEQSTNNSLRSKAKNTLVTGLGLKGSTMLEELTTGTKKVKNPYLVQLMPRNSIVGINITGGKAHSEKDAEVFFPFFPAHLGMPAKPGEQVWVFYENIGKKRVGYWLFRKTGTVHVDDLNYTFLDRQESIADLMAMKNDPNVSLNKAKFNTLVENLAYSFPDPRGCGDGSGNSSINPDSLVKDSLSYDQEFVGELVPRYRKKCGDLVLQGSNNTLIAMTEESEIATGKICLVAGRAADQNGFDDFVSNKRGTSSKSLEHREINKTRIITDPNIVSDAEGDIEGIGKESAKLELRMAGGGVIDMRTTNNSIIHIDNSQIVLAKSNTFDYSKGQITILDASLGIEAPEVVSIRSPGPQDPVTKEPNGEGKIKLAYTGDYPDNPTMPADILMNAGTQPYIRYDELRSLLTDICADLAAINAVMGLVGTALTTEPIETAINTALTSMSVVGGLTTLNEITVAAGSSPLFAQDPKISVFPTNTLTTELSAAGRIGSGNAVGERGTIASQKIFGS